MWESIIAIFPAAFDIVLSRAREALLCFQQPHAESKRSNFSRHD
jgi:hypothetical protein